MEDYTYHLVPNEEAVLGAHMLEVCPSIAGDAPSCEIHPLSIGNRGDPVRLVFTAAAGPAVVAGLLDMGDRFRLVVNEIDVIPLSGCTADSGGSGSGSSASGPALIGKEVAGGR
jgi:L-arabinose isomerase